MMYEDGLRLTESRCPSKIFIKIPSGKIEFFKETNKRSISFNRIFLLQKNEKTRFGQSNKKKVENGFSQLSIITTKRSCLNNAQKSFTPKPHLKLPSLKQELKEFEVMQLHSFRRDSVERSPVMCNAATNTSYEEKEMKVQINLEKKGKKKKIINIFDLIPKTSASNIQSIGKNLIVNKIKRK